MIWLLQRLSRDLIFKFYYLLFILYVIFYFILFYFNFEMSKLTASMNKHSISSVLKSYHKFIPCSSPFIHDHSCKFCQFCEFWFCELTYPVPSLGILRSAYLHIRRHWCTKGKRWTNKTSILTRLISEFDFFFTSFLSFGIVVYVILTWGYEYVLASQQLPKRGQKEAFLDIYIPQNTRYWFVYVSFLSIF